MEDDADDTLIDLETFKPNKENIFDTTLDYANYLESIRGNRIPFNNYKNGDNPLLDKMLSYLKISKNKSMYSQVKLKANKIARNHSLSEREKAEAYLHLVEWGMNEIEND
ncbi:hypothetical protein ACQKIC_05460 [Peribacillus sp. NPDC046944]|uniref:hypothetical protein n=1 Tax=unclassified Peribacillus TaxID=2675266 RepID=UPI003D05E21F